MRKRLKFKTKERLTHDQILKSISARRFGKKVPKTVYIQQDSRTVMTNMTYYWNNVLIEVSENFPHNIVYVYVENDHRTKRDVTISLRANHQKHDVAEHIQNRKITMDQLTEAVHKGLVVDDHKVDNYGIVRYNKYYYYNDICVLATARKENCVEVQTAYRVTPVSDIGFLNEQVGWMIKQLMYNSEVARCYVVDRTASQECIQKNKAFLMLPLMMSSLLRLDEDERQAWKKSEVIQCIARQTHQIGQEMNVIPWDSRRDMGTTFNAVPSHSYTFVVEIDKKLDALGFARNTLKRYGLDDTAYSSAHCILPGSQSDTVALMFDLREFSGDPHYWAQPRKKRIKS